MSRAGPASLAGVRGFSAKTSVFTFGVKKSGLGGGGRFPTRALPLATALAVSDSALKDEHWMFLLMYLSGTVEDGYDGAEEERFLSLWN